ncbi:hypothetical protein DSO57_1037054 [Entomophthora muscae]|uniref:Uncharacterized protein n=2 Tax=Entomophthora muscae TaxID=34485 RepID=A0ACC2SZ80_9FUNG|nr:hypothetical protein DSO57_1037054 [Entomophthora muscae]
MIVPTLPSKTPLPNPQFFILLCIRFSEPIAFTLLFPFVFFMVQDFNMTDDKKMIGYYAGLISSSFAIGEFLSGVPWGMLSDKIGRKPVMMMGLIGTMISMFLFGLSKNLAWAMTTRFMAGILNGNIGVLKTMIGEMTDRTNRAQAFSYASMVFGLGLIIGPALGGFLTHPYERFPLVFGNILFLKKYPYFLPCAVSSLLCAFSFIAAHIFLEETLNRPSLTPNNNLDETAPLMDPISTTSVSAYGEASPKANSASSSTESSVIEISQNSPRAISKGTFLVMLSNMGLSLIVVMSDELFPFWAGTKVHDGGLGYLPQDIGALNSMMGVVLIAMQLGLYRPLQSRFSTLTLMRWAFILFIPLFAIMPIAKFFVDREQTHVAWILLTAIFSLRTFCNMLGFTSYNILLPESCESKEVLGRINGISQALGSLMRGVGPYLCGVFWSWSLKNEIGFPFDYHFTFFTISLISFVMCLIVLKIHPEMVAF